ncbi:MAG: LptF/LptG family permease [Halarsenatibacteraceae bacterium]
MPLIKPAIIDKYIFKEMARPYIAGVMVIGIVMLSNFLYEVAELIIVQEVPVNEVLRLLLYQLPEIFVQSFPMAVLFAVMSGLGRLTRENEFAALRMGGYSLYRLAVPLIVFGVLISIFTFVINEQVVPWTNHQARNIIRSSMLQDVMPEVRENVFFEGPGGRVFYVQGYDEEDLVLSHIVIFDQEESDDFPEVITADEGQVMGSNWQLQSGHVHSYDSNGRLEMAAGFEQMTIELEDDMEKFLARQRTPAEMSRAELRREIQLFQRSGIDVRRLLVDYHMKLALPLTPLIFVLIGMPLSLGNRESRALSLALTVIIIFLYYLLVSFSRSLGRNGVMSPLVAAWLPNGFFAIIGINLIIWRNKWYNLLNSLLARIF